MIIYEAHFKYRETMLGALFSFELWTYIMCFCFLGTVSHRITCHSFISSSSPGRGEWVWIFLIYRWKIRLRRSWLSVSLALVWGGSDSVHQASGSRLHALRFHARCYFRLTATLSCQAANLSIGQSADSLKDGLSSPPPQTQQPFPFCLWQCWENYLLNPDQLHSSSLTLTGHLHLSKDTSLRPYLQKEGNLLPLQVLWNTTRQPTWEQLHSHARNTMEFRVPVFFLFLSWTSEPELQQTLVCNLPECLLRTSSQNTLSAGGPRSEPILLHISLEWVLFLSWGWSFWVYFFVITAQQFLTEAGAY